jgi:hypothetical protein
VTPEAAIREITGLQNFFGSKVSDEKLRFYCVEFRDVPDRVFEEAVAECKRGERSFPTPKVLGFYVAEAQRKVKEFQRAKTSRSIKDLFKPNGIDPKYYLASMKLLSRITEIKHGHPEHLCGEALRKEMLVMEQERPGFGWKEAAESYKDGSKNGMKSSEQNIR